MKNIFMKIGCYNYNKKLNMWILIDLELYFNLLSTFFEFDVSNFEQTQRRLNLYLTCTDVVLKMTCFWFKVKLNLLKRTVLSMWMQILKEIEFWKIDSIFGKLFKYV